MQAVLPNNDRYLEAVCLFLSNSDGIDPRLLQDPHFLTFCSEHRILVMLANHPQFPKIEDPKLKQFVQHLQVSQLKLIQTLIVIQEALTKANISCIHLKGPVLSYLLYNNPYVRQSKDLDIWVDLNDLEKTIEILESLSFRSQTIWKTPKQKKAILKYHHALEFVNDSTDQLVELHWRLPDLDQLMYRDAPTIEVKISDHPMRTLDVDILYIYLCNHGARHAYFRLLWLLDIRQMRQQNQTLKIKIGQPNWLLAALNFETPTHSPSTPIEREALKELKNHVCLSINSTTLGSRLKELLRYHRRSFILGGFRGLLSGLVGRNVRPENWNFFVFPDIVFFLNHVFSRPIWLLRLIFERT